MNEQMIQAEARQRIIDRLAAAERHRRERRARGLPVRRKAPYGDRLDS